MTPHRFGLVVTVTAILACALCVSLGFVIYRQHRQLQVACRYALASTSPEYVTMIRKETGCR